MKIFSCSDGGGRTSLIECTRQHIPGTSRSRSHFLSYTVCGAVRFLCRASPCCSAMHLATHCLACCSVHEDNTLGSGCSCTYQDPRLFRLVQSVYFITPVVAGVWIMGQVTEGGAWHQGAAGNFHSVVRQMPSSQLPGAPGSYCVANSSVTFNSRAHSPTTRIQRPRSRTGKR